jgi:hypothetical protein
MKGTYVVIDLENELIGWRETSKLKDKKWPDSIISGGKRWLNSCTLKGSKYSNSKE